MKTLLRAENGVSQTLHTDAHIKNRQVFRTVYHNDAALEKNKALRNSGLLRRGDKLSLLDGASVSFAFSFPTVEEYNMIRGKYPDIMDAIRSKDQKARESAARKLEILHPEYITISE